MGERSEGLRVPLSPLTVRNCVVVGNLNPAILEPKWIVKEGILPAGDVAAEFAFAATGSKDASFVPRFRLGGLAWIPLAQRLEVQALDDAADAGLFVAEVLKRLSHTPVKAIGNNFHFEPRERGEKLLSLIDCRGLRDFAHEGDQQLGTEYGIKFSHEDGVLNLSLTASLDRVMEVRFNFHREMVDASEAAKAAECWRLDLGAARSRMAEIERLAA